MGRSPLDLESRKVDENSRGIWTTEFWLALGGLVGPYLYSLLKVPSDQQGALSQNFALVIAGALPISLYIWKRINLKMTKITGKNDSAPVTPAASVIVNTSPITSVKAE